MRTNAPECAELGRILAEKVNAYTAPVLVLWPLRGISVISALGQSFYDSEADAALLDGLKIHLRPGLELEELDCAINDPEFARRCANALLAAMQNSRAATLNGIS